MLFLGITSPKKEIFLGTYGNSLGVPIMHGVGGSFDVLAGVTKRAPLRWQRMGLEWGYRTLQEPRRMWKRYLTTNTKFLFLLAKEIVLPTESYAAPRSHATPLQRNISYLTKARPSHTKTRYWSTAQSDRLRPINCSPVDYCHRSLKTPRSRSIDRDQISMPNTSNTRGLTMGDSFTGRVAVIGLGYIGLPTAVALATRGVEVIGVDVNPDTVKAVSHGQVPFVEPDLAVAVSGAVAMGRLTATSDTPHADAYIIAVPTPFNADHSADVSYIRSAAESIAPQLKGGEIIVLESTSPPGTTEDLSRWIGDLRPDLRLPHAGEGWRRSTSPTAQNGFFPAGS